jgi:hypothetical protein
MMKMISSAAMMVDEHHLDVYHHYVVLIDSIHPNEPTHGM